jgi:hypothetical protein
MKCTIQHVSVLPNFQVDKSFPLDEPSIIDPSEKDKAQVFPLCNYPLELETSIHFHISSSKKKLLPFSYNFQVWAFQGKPNCLAWN